MSEHETSHRPDGDGPTRFEDLGRQKTGLLRETLEFLRENRKYWLLPMVFVLALLALAVFLSTGSGSFVIYTLF